MNEKEIISKLSETNMKMEPEKQREIWEIIEREINQTKPRLKKRGRLIGAVGIVAAALVISLMPHGTEEKNTVSPPSTSPVANGIAHFTPGLNGTIDTIQTEGNPYVVLTNVSEAGQDNKIIRKNEEKIPLPKGKMVSKDHWASDDGSLDLFIGEGLFVEAKTGHMTDFAPAPGFDGIVESANGKEMVIKKVVVDPYSTESQVMKATNETVTIRFADYTKVSPNGGSAEVSPSAIQPGNAVIMFLIGPENEYIATQVTFFRTPREAGWNLK